MSTAELFYELGGIFAKNVEKVERTLDKKLPFSEKVAFIKKNGPALKVTKKMAKCGNIKIFLSFRIYVKSNMENLKVPKLPFIPFLGL